MANVLLPKTRHVVPNFRRFSDTAALGELGRLSPRAPDPLHVDLSSRFAEWNQEQSIGLAGDILGAALVVGNDSTAILDVADFVIGHASVASPSLIGAATLVKTRGQSSSGGTIQLPRLTTFLEGQTRQASFRRIRELKESLARFGPNAIVYTELARLYLIVGNEPKARRNIEIARYLAPHNRYVLRAAARVYAHFDDAERAFDMLHNNPRTAHDPWLASAHLAMAELLEKPNRAMKQALRLLDAADDFAPLSLAELRAGVGSVELRNGDRRRSRKLLQASLLSPNDNALAQIEWALAKDPMFDMEVNAFDVSHNYEALALEAFRARNWTEAVRHCESWLMDMPFSSRPVKMATHIASVVLEDYAAAQAFCEAGRIATLHDPMMVNGLAYALALGGKAEEAERILDEVQIGNVADSRVKICLIATRGLARFRRGDAASGRELYAQALTLAAEHPDRYLREVALLNYVREELKLGSTLPEELVRAVREMVIDRDWITIQIFREKILDILNRQQAMK